MAQSIEAFGKYLLLERLASGGMAEVYLSKSFGAGGIGKFVAVKRILPQFSENQEFIDMFKEEAKIVMNLNHGNVVSIFDFGVEHGQFFLVMELVEGQNLRQVLTFMKKNSKYFSIDQIVHVMKEVSAGLDHAHRCIDASTGKQLNITHRDMSPQNIMLSFEGEVKIVDFGIAKAETQMEQTRSGTIKGKFGYMSPEQAEGQPVDARTDIFSTGIILWELCAQDRLFQAQSEAATLKKIRDCQIPPIRKLNPAVHPELEKIIAKCLTKDKEQRYQTSEAIAKDLSKFLNTQYPDFSKQEFSKFLKALFQETYVDNRRKLAEYAKIEHIPNSSGPVSDRTEIARIDDSDEDQKLNLDTSSRAKIDLSSLKTNSTGTGAGHATGTGSRPQPMRRPSPQTASGISHTNTNITSKSVIRQLPPKPQSGGSSNWGAVSFLVVALAFGGWWYMQKQKKSIPVDSENVGTVVESSTTASAKAANPTETTLSVQSTPSGASVYIDDKMMGETPLIGRIPVGSTFHLRIIKDGYLPAESIGEVAGAQGYTKTMTLMAEPPSGYLTVDAFNAGPNPVVYINNVVVGRALPHSQKIPAGSPVVIKVINPISKIEGGETIVIGQGQKKSVHVILNREAQIPQ